MQNKERNTYIILGLFLFAYFVRLVDLHLPYITFDEFAYVSTGYRMLTGGNAFDNSSIFNYDSPPLAEYFYGIVLFLFGSSGGNIAAIHTARLGSAFLGSLTVVLIYSIARKLFSQRIGVFAALFFALAPMAIAHNKIATLETPLCFMTTLTVYAMLNFRDNFGALKTIIISALAFSTKYFGISAFIIAGIFFGAIKHNSWKKTAIFFAKFTPLFLLIFIAVWPFLWTNTIDSIKTTISFYAGHGKNHAQAIYENLAYTFAQTPELLLVFFAIGFFFLIKRRTDSDKLLLVWLTVPYLLLFALSLSKRSHYFFSALPPFVIIAAIGFDKILSNLGKYRNLFIFAVLLYLVSCVFYIHPWYLDYYNFFVGGTGNVYEKELFEIGYLGEGLGKTIQYLNLVAQENSSIQFYVEPNPTSYHFNKSMRLNFPTTIPDADYVVVNTDCVRKNCVSGWLYASLDKELPEQFNITYEKVSEAGYTKVHEISIRGATLVRTYKKDN